MSISSCAVLMSRSQPKIWRKIQKIGGDNITNITRFFDVCVEKTSIFKIVGARRLQSQVIRKCGRPKRCILGIF